MPLFFLLNDFEKTEITFLESKNVRIFGSTIRVICYCAIRVVYQSGCYQINNLIINVNRYFGYLTTHDAEKNSLLRLSHN
jgi:hypothetical protein